MYWLKENTISPLEFIHAATVGNIMTVKEYIHNGGDINTLPISDNFNNQVSALFGASKNPYLHIIEFLILNGADVNIKNIPHGHTPLMQAVAFNTFNNLQATKLLLNAGADVNIKAKDGKTALDYANIGGNTKIIQLLTPIEFPEFLMEAEEKITPQQFLYSGCYNNNINVVKTYINQGGDVNVKDHKQNTGLIMASVIGFTEAVRLLLKSGASIDEKDVVGRAALSWAANNGHLDVMKLLLDAGANIEAKDRNGTTPLMFAAGHSDIPNGVELLLEYGADIDAKDNDNDTVFIYAWDDDIRRLLEKPKFPEFLSEE
jgi:ankyrin repeat protein